MYKKVIAALLCTTALLTTVAPTYADEPVPGSEVPVTETPATETPTVEAPTDTPAEETVEAVPYTSQSEGPLNISVVYSAGLEVMDGDLVQIQLIFAKTEEVQTIEFDASTATGSDFNVWLPKGEYLVKDVKYTGNNEALKEQPLATTAGFTIGDQIGEASDTASTIIVGIGEEACNAVKENYETVRTSEDFQKTLEEEPETEKETKTTKETQKPEKKVYTKKSNPFLRLIPISIIAVILFGIAFKWHKDGRI